MSSSTWAAPQSPHLIKVREALSLKAEADEIKKLTPLVEKNDIRTIEFLVYQLPRHLNPAVRGHIARILKHVGDDTQTKKKPKHVIKALVDALNDTTLYRDPTEPIKCGEGVINAQWSVQSEAAESLGVLQASTAEAIDKLTQIAKVTEPDRIRARLAAIISLGQIGPAAESSASAVADVLKAKQKQHVRLRQAAIKTLGQLGAGASAELPVLAALLESESYETVSAIYAIGGMGENAKDLVPRFIENVHKTNGLHYSSALAQMGKVVHPFLKKELMSHDPVHRDRALSILSHMGKDSVFSLDEIKKQLSDKDQKIRSKAIGVILRMEELAAPAQSEIEQALHDDDEQIGASAMVSLFMISSNNPLALKQLEQLVKSSKKMSLVCWAVKYAGSDAQSIVPSLEAALSNAKDEYQKIKAAQALMFVEVNSKPGFNAIRNAIRHPNRDVRMSAYGACKRLGKRAQPLLDELRAVREPGQFEQKAVHKAINSVEGPLSIPSKL